LERLNALESEIKSIEKKKTKTKRTNERERESDGKKKREEFFALVFF